MDLTECRRREEIELASDPSSRLSIAESFLAVGADVNAAESSNGFTPLHLAAYFGEIVTFKLLLYHGADPDSKDFFGRTAVDLALNDKMKEELQHIITAFLNED
jgi:ankyrin repeat protein